MPDLSALTANAKAYARPMGIAARVIVDAPTVDSLIDVAWTVVAAEDANEETAVETNVRWAARGSKLPAVEDYALLMIDSQGDPFALVWATG